MAERWPRGSQEVAERWQRGGRETSLFPLGQWAAPLYTSSCEQVPLPPAPVPTSAPSVTPPVGAPGKLMRRNLQVPYHEKDQAKQMGADWDRIRKLWYVPAGVDPTPFWRWWR